MIINRSAGILNARRAQKAARHTNQRIPLKRKGLVSFMRLLGRRVVH